MKDYFSILGVEPTASEDEIKRAYRSLAMKHHPDRGGNQSKFQEIQEAYDVVGDADRRSQYDAERRGGSFRFTVNGRPFEHSFNTGNMDDLFAQFGFNPFGDPFAQHRQTRRNKDLRIRIVMDLADTLQEQTKTVSVQTTNGDRTEVQVTIPRGVTPGTQIKYGGLGDNFFATLPRGDLYVQFDIRAHTDFEVNGVDLMTNLVVNSVEALVGCEKTVRGLDGREFTINIAPGTQPDTRLRLANQGLWVMQQNQRGSLLVNIRMITPALSAQQMQLAQDLFNLMNSAT